MINRKYCDANCPLFPCQLASISMSLRREGEKPRYVIKKIPFKLKQKFVNIYQEGEKGIPHRMRGRKGNGVREAKNVLIDLSTDIMNSIKEGDPEKNIKYKSIYFEHLMTFKSQRIDEKIENINRILFDLTT